MKFRVLMRMLRYMAPSKGNIILVVVVSVLTSLLSVVSIYSILPLLNAVFASSPTATQTTGAQPLQAPNKTTQPSTDAKSSTPAQQQLQLSKATTSAEKLKNWALLEFQQMFAAPTKQLALLKICFFLIFAFALTLVILADLYFNRKGNSNKVDSTFLTSSKIIVSLYASL